MGVEISKRYSYYGYCSFWITLFQMFPVTVLTKVTYRNFEISNLIIFKERFKFNMVAKGKMQNCQYLGNGQAQSKKQNGVKIWDSGGGGGVF